MGFILYTVLFYFFLALAAGDPDAIRILVQILVIAAVSGILVWSIRSSYSARKKLGLVLPPGYAPLGGGILGLLGSLLVSTKVWIWLAGAMDDPVAKYGANGVWGMLLLVAAITFIPWLLAFGYLIESRQTFKKQAGFRAKAAREGGL